MLLHQDKTSGSSQLGRPGTHPLEPQTKDEDSGPQLTLVLPSMSSQCRKRTQGTLMDLVAGPSVVALVEAVKLSGEVIGRV